MNGVQSHRKRPLNATTTTNVNGSSGFDGSDTELETASVDSQRSSPPNPSKRQKPSLEDDFERRENIAAKNEMRRKAAKERGFHPDLWDYDKELEHDREAIEAVCSVLCPTPTTSTVMGGLPEIESAPPPPPRRGRLSWVWFFMSVEVTKRGIF